MIGRNPMQMCNFLVFAKATGAVVRAGTCAFRDLPLQAEDGFDVVETVDQLNPNRVVVVDGMLVAKPEVFLP